MSHGHSCSSLCRWLLYSINCLSRWNTPKEDSINSTQQFDCGRTTSLDNRKCLPIVFSHRFCIHCLIKQSNICCFFSFEGTCHGHGGSTHLFPIWRNWGESFNSALKNVLWWLLWDDTAWYFPIAIDWFDESVKRTIFFLFDVCFGLNGSRNIVRVKPVLSYIQGVPTVRSCVLCRIRPKHSHGRRQRQSDKIQDLNNGKAKTSNKIHFWYMFIKNKEKRKEKLDPFERKYAKFLHQSWFRKIEKWIGAVQCGTPFTYVAIGK
jgi:hypothetical protein